MFIRRICAFAAAAVLLAACLPFPAGAEEYKASAVEEFAGWVEYHACRLETSWKVPCEKTLMEALKEKSAADGKTTVLSELLVQFGILGEFTVVWYEDQIGLENLTYYDGWRIFHLYDAGKDSQLSLRDRETLEAALALTDNLSGSDLEKERALFDALCGIVTYDAEEYEGSSDKDCATGALLNGRADCDGYADAMMLCCSLAGIPCHYIHGRSVDSPRGSDGSHMWNLVYVNGSWLMCDVTWGDLDSGGPGYLFFNLGTEDAAASYVWNRDTLFTQIADRADFSTQLMPDQQPASVTSPEDVYLAVRAAVSAGLRRLTLYCPEEILWETDPETFVKMISHGGAGTHSYKTSGRMYELSGISLPDHPFRFCDSREEILSAISDYADQDIRTFSLFFHPSLSEKLFADGHAELQQLFSETRLEKTGRYQYSEDSGCVMLADVSYTDMLPVCASLEEIAALLRRELPSQPASVTFVLAGGLTFDEIREETGIQVYSLGANSLSFLLSGSRVTLTGLTYFDNYCLAETEDEALAFMRQTLADGKEEMRIYCSEELYVSLCADQANGFFSLLQRAGFVGYSVYTTDEYHVLIADSLR